MRSDPEFRLDPITVFERTPVVTLRALIIGLLYALFIASCSYLNDHVIQQNGMYLIGNHFPMIVFGALIILVIVINPILGKLRVKIFNGKEVAIIVALSLAVCGWPGSSFFRGFSAIVTVPPTLAKANADWQADHVMSYIPGVSPLFAEGFIKDFPGLTKKLYDASIDSQPGPERRVWELLPDKGRYLVQAGITNGKLDQAERHDLVDALNVPLVRYDLFNDLSFRSIALDAQTREQLACGDTAKVSELQKQWLNRSLFEKIFPSMIIPSTKGHGFFLSDGNMQTQAYQDILMQGRETTKKKGVLDVPWKAWWPTIKLWGGLGLLLALASLCLVTIVQPQWKRELLAYPIAKFVQDLTQPAQKGFLPQIAHSKLFWYGMAAAVAIHTLNGLKVWVPNMINVPLQFDFSSLTSLSFFRSFNAFQFASAIFFQPKFFLTFIAFAFFLGTEVSFSVGISGILYMLLYTLIAALQLPGLEFQFLEPASGCIMRFGSYLGIAAMVFYLGRNYYLKVIACTFGRPIDPEISRNAVWAARALIVFFALAVVLVHQNGLDWLLSTLLILLFILLFFVMTRVNVETGTFFIQPYWAPVGVLTALFGIQAIGPSAYIIMALLCTMLSMDPRETVMPFIANAFYMTTDADKKAPPTRMVVLIAVVMVAGFFAALAATLTCQYNVGLNKWDIWTTSWVPTIPFGFFSIHINELSAYNELSQSMLVSNLHRFSIMAPQYPILAYGLFGLALAIGVSLLRIRFSWWPLHPVAFIIWGTAPGSWLAPSFLLGWAIKASIVKFSGVKGFRLFKPFMVGIIAGELISLLAWTLVGIIYFSATGLVPKPYSVYP